MTAQAAGSAAQHRRDVIVARAADLIARQGISGTTVREIGEAAGILSGSLYHHFDSKDSIIDVVMTAYLDDLLGRYSNVLAAGGTVTETFYGLVRASMLAIDAHPEATLIYQNEVHYFRETARYRHVRTAGERVRTTWLDVLEHGVTEGVFRRDIPPRHLYPLLRDGLWLSVRWFRASAGYGYQDLAHDCARLYFQAFASQRTLRGLMTDTS